MFVFMTIHVINTYCSLKVNLQFKNCSPNESYIWGVIPNFLPALYVIGYMYDTLGIV